MKKTTLTIAGSDSSGGAGIQADLKAMTMNGVYAMSAITVLTAQNTTGVRSIQETDPACLKDQIDMIFEDIFPDAIKIGMVSSEKIIDVISASLQKWNAKNIVLDPVMIATSGAKLISEEAIQHLKEKLFPLATLITPNLMEAEALVSEKIENLHQMEETAQSLGEEYNCSVLVKGGHLPKDPVDVLYHQGKVLRFIKKRIHTKNTHGTGCTLSSAIAANLAKGFPLEESVKKAKDYVTNAIRANLDLGKGSGPLDHAFKIKGS
ncbi:MAG: bifunctional hydroxymethylpyrimidine kinase/phosphomethylpyrimidine kinase [Tissierellia bacterium]|nr:bifunctional hydroxymethylpyrimidine kinase/phosphomethylpyrimidine kinase [Tissierellia bacterium]